MNKDNNTCIRLDRDEKQTISPRDTNLDYLMFLFGKHPEVILPATK